MAPVIARHARRWIRPSTSRATPSSTRGHHTAAACPPSSAALSLPVSLSAMQRVHWTSLGIKPRSDVNAAAHSGVLMVEFAWHHSIAHPKKNWYTRRSRGYLLYKLSYSRFRPKFLLPWQRGLVAVGFVWHHSIDRPRKTPVVHKDLGDISYISRIIADFCHKFRCHGNMGHLELI